MRPTRIEEPLEEPRQGEIEERTGGSNAECRNFITTATTPGKPAETPNINTEYRNFVISATVPGEPNASN